MAKRSPATVTLTARKRRMLTRTLRDVREFMDDPLALLERATYLLSRKGDDRTA